MRFYTHHEPGRRTLSWVAIGLAVVVYGGLLLQDVLQTGRVSVFWPAAAFWGGLVAWSTWTLLAPRDYVDVDAAAGLVRAVRAGAVAREVPIGQLAPLEVFQFVPVKGSTFRVRYGVRSRPMPELTFGDHGRLRDAERSLAQLGSRLGLVLSHHVVGSSDLTADGEARWIDADPKEPDAE